MQESSVAGIAHNIALWGPPKSGKSWLIGALKRVIDICDQRDKDFHYTVIPLHGHAPGELDTVSSQAESSQRSVDYHWIIQRAPRYSKSPTPAQAVSAHAHQLLINEVDPASALLLKQDARTVFRDAHLILILLDHTLLTSTEAAPSPPAVNTNVPSLGRGNENDEIDLTLLFSDEPAASSKKQSDEDQAGSMLPAHFSREQYLSYLNDLYNYLSRLGGPRSVVFCITKADQMQMRSTPESLLASLFGPEVKSLFEKCRSRFTTMAVCLSSFGYTLDGAPNYDPRTSRLKVPGEWVPWNVEQPFFWFLEQIESQQLLQSGNWVDGLFRRGNARLYKPYHRLK